MNFADNVKQFTGHQAARMIVQLLDRVSDERLVQLTHLGERLTDDPEIIGGIRGVRELIASGDHPAKRLFYRVLNFLSFKQKVALFECLFLGAWFEGNKKREAFRSNFGFWPPFIMILSPTLKCNLRCKGCYTLGYGLKPELEFEVADDVISQAEEMGINFVTFLGGEPLMYPRLLDLIERHPRIFFQCYTNATLLDADKAQRLAQAGNVLVVISIEGDEEETDSWRGKGVYAKIRRGFDLLREARCLAGTSATVTRDNVQKVASFEFIDRLIEFGSVAHNYFLYLPVNGRADLDLMVTPEQRDHLRRQVMAVRDTRPIFMLDFWNDGPYVGGCIAAGRRYFHVNANGDVEPCVYTHIAVDNIHRTSLAKALDSPLFRTIRRNQPHNGNQLRPCMIIDNPAVMRRIIAECDCRFTHPGAEEIFTELADRMDAYAARWGELAERVWAEEYLTQERWRAVYGPNGAGFVDWHNGEEDLGAAGQGQMRQAGRGR